MISAKEYLESEAQRWLSDQKDAEPGLIPWLQYNGWALRAHLDRLRDQPNALLAELDAVLTVPSPASLVDALEEARDEVQTLTQMSEADRAGDPDFFAAEVRRIFLNVLDGLVIATASRDPQVVAAGEELSRTALSSPEIFASAGRQAAAFQEVYKRRMDNAQLFCIAVAIVGSPEALKAVDRAIDQVGEQRSLSWFVQNPIKQELRIAARQGEDLIDLEALDSRLRSDWWFVANEPAFIRLLVHPIESVLRVEVFDGPDETVPRSRQLDGWRVHVRGVAATTSEGKSSSIKEGTTRIALPPSVSPLLFGVQLSPPDSDDRFDLIGIA